MSGPTPASPRLGPLVNAAETVFNFRDLGGYVTAHGPVRTGPVCRADSLAALPAATLAGISIRTVVDLRSDDTTTGAETVQAFLTERYLKITDIGRHGLRETLTMLADSERLPLAFHCRAG